MEKGITMNRRLATLFVVLATIFGILQLTMFAGFPGATRVVALGAYGRVEYKQIRHLKIGDKVVSCHKNGDYVETTVQRIEKVSSPTFFKISLEGSNRFPVDKTRHEERYFYTSPQQKFYDHKKHTWIEAQYLSTKDSVIRLSSAKYNRIKNIGIHSRNRCSQKDVNYTSTVLAGSTSYNIILDFPHTFFIIDNWYPTNIPPYQEILTHNGDVMTVLLSGVAPVATAVTASGALTAGAIVLGSLGLAYMGYQFFQNQKLLNNTYINFALNQCHGQDAVALFKPKPLSTATKRKNRSTLSAWSL